MKHPLKHTKALLSLAFVLASTSMYGQTSSGVLDPTFGTGGKVITDFGASNEGIAAVAVQSDGKLVAAGSSYLNGGDFALARYNPNGTLDTSFGSGGKVRTDFGGYYEGARSVALQADGKIVAAGGSVNPLYNDFAVARYNSNGTLDTSFGTGGKVITEFFSSFGQASAQAVSVAVQPDGKIVVAGYANIDGGENFALVRYNSDGTLDASFGTAGKVSTPFDPANQGFSYATADSLALQQDGKIVLAGQAYSNGGSDFALARYNSNGTLDTTFGTGGRVITDFATPNDGASSIAVQPDGKIVAAGFLRFKLALARYNSSGSLDTSFGTGGKVTTSISGLNDAANFVALQGDGKIVVAGRTYINGTFHSVLARFNTLGAIDGSFGTAGKVINIFGADSEGVSSIAVQPDGKIAVAGGVSGDFALARFNSGSDSNANTNAAFVKLDTTTGGSWRGVYGLDGFIVIGNSAIAPWYGNATAAGNNSCVWGASTGDTRALQKASPATDRIAACWYSSGVFTINVNFTDASLHQVALYMLDWNGFGGGRSQRVEVFDANNNLLDTRMVSGFTAGQYLVWNLTGHVTIRVTNTNPNSNAVVSGLFFR